MRRATLNSYHAGDLVQVRSAAEILATLDKRGTNEGLPFMPEMIPYLGQTLTVSAAVQKLCWFTPESSSRQIDRTVILEQLRCPGSGHGGCGAECRLYWKEAWLRATADAPVSRAEDQESVAALTRLAEANTRERRVVDGLEADLFRCQYTDLVHASTPIRELEPLQYVGELRSGNIGVVRFLSTFIRAFWWRVARRLFRHVPEMPKLAGTARTDGEKLDLQVGELVEVRSLKEIGATLDERARHRGLTYTQELTPRCGKQFRVRGRVERLIDKDTGRMIELKNDCITLDGVVCSGDRTPGCWFCPAEHYTLWREAWLRRAGAERRLEGTQATRTDQRGVP